MEDKKLHGLVISI